MWIRSGRRVLPLVAIATLLPSTAAPPGLRQQIIGTWIPVTQYVDQDCKRLEPFGSHPKGIVVYDADGHFVLVLQKESRCPSSLLAIA